MWKLKGLFCILLTLIVLAGCGIFDLFSKKETLPPSSTDTGAISGKVEMPKTRAAEEIQVIVQGTKLFAKPEANGNFRISGVPVGEQTVSAITTSGESLGAHAIVTVYPGKESRIEEPLRLLPCGIVAGMVTEDTGEGGPFKPIKGAIITAQPEEPPQPPNGSEPISKKARIRHFWLVAVTGADGSYMIRGVPPGIYKVTAKKEGYEEGVVEGVSVEVGRTAAVDFQLTPISKDKGVVAGKVMETVTFENRSMDLPVLEAKVELLLKARNAKQNNLVTYTDWKGEYAIRNVPPGTYLAKASKEGYKSAQREVLVKAGQVTEANFTLEREMGVLLGQVTDATNDKPLPKASVAFLVSPIPLEKQIKPDKTRFHYIAETDERGHYSMRVPAGTHPFIAWKEGYAEQVKEAEIFPDKQTQLNFQLHPLLPPPTEELSAQVFTDRPEYKLGEPVQMTLVLTNHSTEPVQLTFTSSQIYDFIVCQREKEVWRWSYDKAFIQVICEMTLQPGESKTHHETWDQKDNRGNQVPIGEYHLIGLITSAKPPPIKSEPVIFYIEGTQTGSRGKK